MRLLAVLHLATPKHADGVRPPALGPLALQQPDVALGWCVECRCGAHAEARTYDAAAGWRRDHRCR